LSSNGDDESAAARQVPVLSRRGLFGLAGAGVVGAGIGFAAHAFAVPHEPSAISGTSEFYGTHQAGIVTAAQDRLHFASFDLAEGTGKDDLISLLKDWTAAAAQMTRGQDAGAHGALGGSPEAPPDDTGEALDLDPAGLTITFGFGPSLFDNRFGLGARRPEALADLPHFPADALRPELCGGDLCIQACSNDPQIAVHAIRNLSRIAFGRASLRWSQLGFGRTSSTTKDQLTPRNLFGFKDGTANVKVEDTQQVEDHIWARASDGAKWMHGGSYLVARKIRMTIEVWDRQSLREQERVFGRAKGDGAPLSGGTEFSALDFHKSGTDGTPLIDPDSHVHLAHRSSNSGAVLLRRGYNYVDGNDELGRLNAGLFFICFQRDPRTQFVAIQSTLAGRDAMNEYIRHIGSAIFAVPPGVADGSYVGATLFD
jgi:deferrochelatase/peroxidase EfeB